MKGLWKKVWICGMGLTVLLTGCGSSAGGQYAAEANYSYSAAYGAEELYGGDGIYEMSAAESGDAGSASQSVREGRKLIRTVRLEVETLEFDQLLAYVQNKTEELGGYIESLNVYNGSGYSSYYGSGYRQERNASLTLRIPRENLDGFMTEVDARGNIISRNEQEEDVTLAYVDLDSHKQVLLAEQERLLAMMEQAETMEDLIILESRLSDIRYQIESMESRLRTYDNQIEYSTVYLRLDEVVELTPIVVEEKTAWQRMGEGFMDSLKNIGNGIKEFCISFVIALPYLIILFVFVGVLIWFIFFIVKKNSLKRQKLFEAQREFMQKQQTEYEKHE